MNLCVINNPDSVGLLCDFDTSSISLGGRRAFGGLPNMPNYSLGALAGSPCDTLEIVDGLEEVQTYDFKLYPNPTSDILVLTLSRPDLPLGKTGYLQFAW